MDVYERLAEFLDTLPAGYPRTEDGRELKLLRTLFTPEEAEMAQQLTLIAEPARVIARRVKRPVDEVAEQLEGMARKGLVYSIHRGDDPPEYMATQYAIGFFEFQVGRFDEEMASANSAFMETISPRWWEQMPQMRTIPVGESIPTGSTVMIYEEAENLVRSQDRLRVNPCVCRKQKKLLGQGCDKPLESCLAFGDAADYYERLGVGRAIDQEEALSILERAEEAGLVLQPGNTQTASFICCCCSDCCEVFAIAKRHPRPAEILVSPFRAEVDEVLCSACGDCEFRCQMEAIGLDNGYALVDKDRCIGCGLCVTDCPEEAVTLVRKPEEEQLPVPRNTVEQYIGGLRTRGMVNTRDLIGWQARSKVDRFLARD
ncbi:MAG TPA: 4Fe-4S binding protein [Anaerolineae bacterium]|jgi:Fe-S-cluster-containing hydrogenase component 2|nr:4Fe-4S binding protein [Anaerolineae bacterium]